MKYTDPSPILLFDGVCNLCSASVQWVLTHDTREQFRFASLQSDFGRKLMQQHGIDPDQVSSVLLFEGNQYRAKSDVPLRVLEIIGGWWRVFIVFRLVPQSFRDWIYHQIAQHRYRWFGKKQTCWMPKMSWKHRFLDF